jgi:hypothetical protein
MGEYEPHDSRNVTLEPRRAPGEPPRTGPREGETRRRDKRSDAEKRERAIEQDTAELDAALREERKR